MKTSILVAAIVACTLSAPVVFGAELKVKALSPAEDATQKTVLIGRNAKAGPAARSVICGREVIVPR